MVHQDRTRDFFECAKGISKTGLPPAPRTAHSSFYVAAKQISRDIYATHEKLEKLAKRTLFFHTEAVAFVILKRDMLMILCGM